MKGKEIEKARKVKKMSRYALAKKANLSEPTIKAVEEDNPVVSTTLEKVAEALDYEFIFKPKSNDRPDDPQY